MNSYQIRKLLICDDDDAFRERLSKSFNARGVDTCLASSATEAIEVLQDYSADTAILDLKMPGESGLSLLKALKQKYPALRVLILTGYGSISTAIEAVKSGAHNYLTKPSSIQSIIAALCDKPEQASVKIPTPSLEEVEKEYVNRVLNENEGNISRAAKALGMHRRSLQRKLLRG